MAAAIAARDIELRMHDDVMTISRRRSSRRYGDSLRRFYASA
jgi:hypothetical protein